MVEWAGYSTNGGSDDKVILDSMYDGGGDYDWAYGAVLEDPAGRRYVYSDSGCSCNGPWEYEPDYTLVGTAQEAIDAGRWWDDTDKENWKSLVLDLDWRK